MAIVEFQINKSKFQIQCPENEQEKLLNLAKKIDERVKNLAQSLKNADEKTLLAITTLTMQDELESAKQNQGSNANDNNEKIYQNLTEIISKMTNNIDDLTKKIEKY